MKIGTKSLLFGAHCFFIHPWFVALAWWRLYGFPFDPRLWIVFVIHDWGYWGSPNMDGEEGEQHPVWAANVMSRWFGPKWEPLCLFHSRFLARQAASPPSPLCAADKLAIALIPWWLYLPGARLAGEVAEYRHQIAPGNKYDGESHYDTDTGWRADKRWFWGVQGWCSNFAWQNYRSLKAWL